MSEKAKVRVVTLLVSFILSSNIAWAAPSRNDGPDGFFSAISKIVRQIGRVLHPLDEPAVPKP